MYHHLYLSSINPICPILSIPIYLFKKSFFTPLQGLLSNILLLFFTDFPPAPRPGQFSGIYTLPSFTSCLSPVSLLLPADCLCLS